MTNKTTTNGSTGLLKGRTVLLLTAAHLALFAGVAQAQSANGSGNIEQVVVSGTRITNAGYEAPTPVTAIAADQLLTNTPSSIADSLIQLPQLSGSATRSYCCAAGVAGNYLNLRQMGANRTLVLFNGNRISPSTSSGVVDVNVLPEMLVQRVEIVTGGASAAYGSDAVAGVVNYISDKDFEGLKINLQGGISQYSDDEQLKAGVAGGMSVLNGHGHLTGSFEHYQTSGIPNMLSRPLSKQSWVLGGAGTLASPYVNVANTTFYTGTVGGLIILSPSIPLPLPFGPAVGTDFGVGGTWSLGDYNPGTAVPGNSIARVGGDGYTPGIGMQPLGSLRTDHLYGRFGYDFSENLKGFVQINASHDISQNQYGYSSMSSGGADLGTIYSGNAFLPANLQSYMTANSMASFTLSRGNQDIPPQYNHTGSNYGEFSAGLDGKLAGDWTWNTYFAYGFTKASAAEHNSLNVPHLLAALDAVMSGGNVVCNVALTSPGAYPGCVPINVFGKGSPSQAAINYVTGTNKYTIDNKQTVADLNFQGTVFALPAGDVSVATGIEVRERQLSGTSNAVATTQINPSTIRGIPSALCPTLTTCRIGGWQQGNMGPQAPVSDTVKEAYVETIVPLAKNSLMAKDLELNAAARFTNYSNSGDAFTWKVGLTYQPLDDIKFRATESHDIRAPNLYELFASPSTGFAAFVVNPWTGLQLSTVPTVQAGNPNLKPEASNTYTIGAVITPSFIAGLNASVDYYSVRLAGGIQPTSTAQAILNACHAGSAASCALINGDTVAGTYFNLITLQSSNASVEHRAGLDFDVTYTPPIDHWLNTDANLTFRLLTNYVTKADTIQGGLLTSYAGQAGLLTGPANLPRWRGFLSATYNNGPFTFAVEERYIGSMNKNGPTGPAVFAQQTVPWIFYTNITGKYDIDTGAGPVQLYGTINNLFNQQPPLFPNTLPGVGYPTPVNLYDLDGRYFTIGVRFQM